MFFVSGFISSSSMASLKALFASLNSFFALPSERANSGIFLGPKMSRLQLHMFLKR